MRKKVILCFSMAVFFTSMLTACNSRESVEHMSQEDMISYVGDVINEPVSYISAEIINEDKTIYKFLLDERNIEFEVRDIISNNGLNLDGAQFFDNYQNEIRFDYQFEIVQSLADERQSIAESYNITETMYENLGCYNIVIDNYSDLTNLIEFIVSVDKLYSFCATAPEYKYWTTIEKDVISFSDIDASIESVEYSLSNDSRLEYDTVYNILLESYINKLKQFQLTDETIPQEIWNKY